MFSPSSGRRKSVAPLATGAGAAGATGRVAAGRRRCHRYGLFSRRFRGRGFALDALGLGALYFRARAVLHGKNHLADFYFLAFLDADFLDRTGYGRWNFDDCLVGLQLHHRLPFGDARTQRDHQPDQVALVDVFAEFRQLEFCH